VVADRHDENDETEQHGRDETAVPDRQRKGRHLDTLPGKPSHVCDAFVELVERFRRCR
jgi:hypothetical protein